MTKRLTGVSVSDLPELTKVDVIKMLAEYNHNRDEAVGLRLSRHTHGLIWYGHEKAKKISKRMMQAAVTKGALDGIRGRMKEIMSEAETASHERKLELLAEAKQLQKSARRMGKQNA